MWGAKALTTLDNGHLSILCSWHLWKGDRENWEEKSLEDLRPLCQPTLNSQSVLKAKWYQSMKSHFIVITLTSTRKPWLGSTSEENNMFKTLWWHWLRNNQCIRHPVGTNLTPENSWTPYLNYCMPLPANIYIYIYILQEIQPTQTLLWYRSVLDLCINWNPICLGAIQY